MREGKRMSEMKTGGKREKEVNWDMKDGENGEEGCWRE